MLMFPMRASLGYILLPGSSSKTRDGHEALRSWSWNLLQTPFLTVWKNRPLLRAAEARYRGLKHKYLLQRYLVNMLGLFLR
jgi:hypothetical protein